jgi:large subunit ribosomal protein L30
MANTMSKIKITLVKSPIDKSKRQKDTLKSLGFNKVNQTVERENNPQTMGMIRVVEHLVQVVEA